MLFDVAIYVCDNKMLPRNISYNLLAHQFIDANDFMNLYITFEKIEQKISDFYDDIPDFPNRDEWRLKYICEKIISVFTDFVSFNHLSREKIYVQMKQSEIWAVIINNTTAEIMTSDEFKDIVYAKTAEILDKLIEIREYYKKEEK